MTRNQDKENHYINGMLAEVEAYHAESKALQVKTISGKRLAIPLHGCQRAARAKCLLSDSLGYAGAIHIKYQGAELERVTLWLDRKWSPAAGYVVLSRVSRDEDYLIGGVVTVNHFLPAK